MSNEKVNPNTNKQINSFVKWYFKNFIVGNRTDFGEYHAIKDIKNLIEKMAVWYELKYPDYEINRILKAYNNEDKYLTDSMKETYNTNNFIHNLPYDEEYYFNETVPYSTYLYAYRYTRIDQVVELHLDEYTGTITSSKGLSEYTNNVLKDEEVINKPLTELYKLLLEKNIDDKGPDKDWIRNTTLTETIHNELETVELNKELHDRLLDAIMYRIIERGGCRTGSRRAFLFAKEFKRDISIPMKYIDTSDPYLRDFINEYIKSGGSKDIECYDNYDQRIKDNVKVETIPLVKLLKMTSDHNSEEEQELHQRLVNDLAYREKQLVKKK